SRLAAKEDDGFPQTVRAGAPCERSLPGHGRTRFGPPCHCRRTSVRTRSVRRSLSPLDPTESFTETMLLRRATFHFREGVRADWWRARRTRPPYRVGWETAAVWGKPSGSPPFRDSPCTAVP